MVAAHAAMGTYPVAEPLMAGHSAGEHAAPRHHPIVAHPLFDTSRSAMRPVASELRMSLHV
jgi:hypothetical protein